MTPRRNAIGASCPPRSRRAGGRSGLWASLALACGLALAGCAGGWVGPASVPNGLSHADVLARLGPPTRVVPLPSGERLQYSLQPLGQSATMVDLDSAGRVVSVRQVLAPDAFARVVDGQWTRADVEREFGPPARVDSVSYWTGSILTYRWSDGSDMFFFVYLDPRQVVQRTQTAMEFVNAPDRE